eukprot:TRINITY_DN3144_c0_g1_i1.p6 TRINITY_DN3144_c0_g1~~TRINITY_DN3144_c0_g1_i1.p6  ORF type:complete len:110 (+),score=11.75 TRINITY_DN3144_c0_g1_i1:818-1147(+)
MPSQVDKSPHPPAAGRRCTSPASQRGGNYHDRLPKAGGGRHGPRPPSTAPARKRFDPPHHRPFESVAAAPAPAPTSDRHRAPSSPVAALPPVAVVPRAVRRVLISRDAP